jgi:hypothetical protein
MKTNNMKSNWAGYALFALLMGVCASCSQNEFEDENTLEAVKLTVSVEEGGVRTRSTDFSVDRFLIEVYTDNTYSTPALGVFKDSTNKAVTDFGDFTLILDRNKDYYCLLWADKAGSACYTVSDLKAVTLVSGQKPVEAWHGKITIPKGNTATFSKELKRAVAKLSLMETGVILSNSSLGVAFNQPTVFNVATAVASNPAATSFTLDLSAGATGTTTVPQKLNASDIYVMASASSAVVTSLTFSMASSGLTEPSFDVTNVPFQANYNTFIKGHYTTQQSSTFTLVHSELWNTFDE